MYCTCLQFLVRLSGHPVKDFRRGASGNADWPLDCAAVAPPKRKTGGGRTTAKGTRPGDGQKYANPTENKAGVHASARYTPPVPPEMKLPKPWVPWLMVGLFVTGMVIIMVRNLAVNSNWLTLAGLACILGGLFTATKWR